MPGDEILMPPGTSHDTLDLGPEASRRRRSTRPDLHRVVVYRTPYTTLGYGTGVIVVCDAKQTPD